MEDVIFEENIFRVADFEAGVYLPHIFCTEGELFFVQDGNPYKAVKNDCIIASLEKPLDQLLPSKDFRCEIMLTTRSFAESNKPLMSYNIVGHLGMMQNPLLHLLPSEMKQCLKNLENIRVRFGQPWHSFYAEAVRKAFEAFVLDMYDIHARQGDLQQEDVGHGHILMRRFIAMLQEGQCRRHRTPGYYAEKLSITPVYLTEISRVVTHHTPTYWIDYFAANEIRELLKDRRKPLGEIAEELNFSSISYFSRYCTKVFGVNPSKLR